MARARRTLWLLRWLPFLIAMAAFGTWCWFDVVREESLPVALLVTFLALCLAMPIFLGAFGSRGLSRPRGGNWRPVKLRQPATELVPEPWTLTRVVGVSFVLLILAALLVAATSGTQYWWFAVLSPIPLTLAILMIWPRPTRVPIRRGR